MNAMKTGPWVIVFTCVVFTGGLATGFLNAPNATAENAARDGYAAQVLACVDVCRRAGLSVEHAGASYGDDRCSCREDRRSFEFSPWPDAGLR